MINLQELNYKDEIILNEKVLIPKEYYEKMDITNLSKIKVKGNIKLDEEDNYLIDLAISGVMTLHDSLTYDLVDYPFTIKIEETLENSLKTLDLNEFLWHYIVLEVPLRLTNSEMQSINNEHYRVISEEEYNRKNNPFSDFSI